MQLLTGKLIMVPWNFLHMTFPHLYSSELGLTGVDFIDSGTGSAIQYHVLYTLWGTECLILHTLWGLNVGGKIKNGTPDFSISGISDFLISGSMEIPEKQTFWNLRNSEIQKS